MDLLSKQKLGDRYFQILSEFYQSLIRLESPTNLGGLTLTEAFPIMVYISHHVNGVNFCKEINNYIRINHDIRNPRIEEVIRLLDQALKNISPHNSSTVYRMITNVYEEDMDNMQESFIINKGRTFVVNHFLSTSHVSWPDKKLILKINTLPSGSKARDVEKVSYNHPDVIKWGEREVLFERGAKFYINDFKIENGFMIVEVDEIDSPRTDLVFRFNLLIN